MKQNENRKFDRQQLVYYLKVLDTTTHEVTGYLGDISCQGLMIFRPDPIELDLVLNLSIGFDPNFGMAGDLVFDARSVWCERDVNPDYYIAGFKFIDLPQSGLDMVAYLTRKYGFA